MKATTILAIKKDGQTVIAGDGQVTFGNNTIIKATAKKIRSLADGKVLAGFAGSVADAFTLFDLFEEHLNKASGKLKSAAVNFAKSWRKDKFLRKLDALLIVADVNSILIISGQGEIIEPDDNIAAVGSGAFFALAAAKALISHSNLPAIDIAQIALNIAADICVFTNHNISSLSLEAS